MAMVLKRDTPEIVSRQLRFFEAISGTLIPSKVRRRSSDAYVYEWVEGKEASCAAHIEMVANKMPGPVWKRYKGRPVPTAESRIYYVRYVMEKARAIFRREELKVVGGILATGIASGKLRGAWEVHGDLTLENVIVRADGKGFTMIDPGHPRGLYCEELDITKLMQSVITHWEMAKGKRTHAIDTGGWKIRPETLALLLSHWIRLLPHREKHNKVVLGYGRHVVVPAIIDEASGKEWQEYASSDGHGWSPDRLSRRCLRGLQERL